MPKYASADTIRPRKTGLSGEWGGGRRSGSHSIYEINRQGYETWGSLNDIGLPKPPTPSSGQKPVQLSGDSPARRRVLCPSTHPGQTLRARRPVPEQPYAPMSTAPRHGHGSSAARWTYCATGVSEKPFRPPGSVPAPAAAAPPRGGSNRTPGVHQAWVGGVKVSGADEQVVDDLHSRRRPPPLPLSSASCRPAPTCARPPTPRM